MDAKREKRKGKGMAAYFRQQGIHPNLILICTVISILFLSIVPKGLPMNTKKHIVLLGASVGKKWDIENLPQRINNDKYTFEYVGIYAFDKTKALTDILQRKENKPDVIFLKECAAYFPGNLNQYKSLMEKWITACQEADVIPILTTVVPVIRKMSLKTKAKDFIKRVVGKPQSTARLKQLLSYNDWIRSYAAQNDLAVLDLERALRVSDSDRSLRLDLHSGDGLHLNENAYRLLDEIVIDDIEQALEKKE